MLNKPFPQPRWYKNEVLESVAAEYERLGRPLDHADLNPDHIVEFVGAHFSSSASSSFSDPPRPPGSGEPAAPLADVGVFYHLNHDYQTGTWVLNAIGAVDGQLVQEMVLPDPGHGGFYTLLYSGGEFAVQVAGQQPVPCADIMAGYTEAPSTAPPPTSTPPPVLPPGVAAHSSVLPGMVRHGAAGATHSLTVLSQVI